MTDFGKLGQSLSKRGTMNDAIEVNATIVGHSKIDFDKRIIRRTLLKEGRAVQRLARRMVARKAISKPGEYPGKRTGGLQKAIDVVRGSAGFWVRVEPTTAKIKKIRDIWYPAILYYGSKKINLEPRRNYMTDALDARRDQARAALQDALQQALKPR